MRPAAFAKVLRQQQRGLESNARAAAEANAQMLGSRIREHIARDDLPLDALSPQWIAFKLSRGKPRNHLWYTGDYLSRFRVEAIRDGYTVGTNRPVMRSSFNLPRYLEERFPVWRLTLDETKREARANAAEALEAAIKARAPKFKRQ